MKVIGFDIRTCEAAVLARIWAPDDRRYFLLRPDVVCPISVDSAVFPSIFRYDADAASPDQIERIVVEPESTHQCVLRLWPRLHGMRDTAAAAGITFENTMVIAVTASNSDALFQGDWQWHDILGEPVSPEKVLADWKFLGFDAVDKDLTSGLSNCTFDLRKDERFISRWAKHVNKYGLFESQNAAHSFIELLDENVPEHAPFAPFGIYEIP